MAIPNEPITRKEKYLAKASGQNVETPDPLTREEMYLDTIAKGGGGGGGGGADLPDVTSADNGKVLSVVSGEWNKADAPKELPTTTTSDNGKVLAVVNGAWAKATPSGGGSGGGLVIHKDKTTGTLDKTFLEIYNAMLDGTVPCVVDQISAGQVWSYYFSYIYGAYYGDGEYHLLAYKPVKNGASVTFQFVDYVAYEEDEYPELYE